MELWSSHRAGIIAVTLALLSGAGTSHAAIWVGAGGGGDGVSYGNPLNWDTGVVPSGGTPVTINGAGFGATSGSPLVINLGGVDRTTSGITNISNFVRFINTPQPTTASPGDFIAGAGTFTATDVVFDTGVGIGPPTAMSTTVFTNVTYNVPSSPAGHAPIGFRTLGPDLTFTNSNVTSQSSWTLRSSLTLSPTLTIDGSSTSAGLLDMNVSSSNVQPADVIIRNGSTSTFRSSGAANIGDDSNSFGTPTLTIQNSTANFQVGNFNLGRKAVLVTQNANVEFRGHVNNFMPSPTNFDGEGLTVRFNPEFPGTKANHEVSGTDFGVNSAGLINNYSIDKLILGGLAGRTIVLVDTRDNDNNDGDLTTTTINGPSEALYTDVLELASNTSIELNGLRLGYESLVFNGFSLTVYQTNSLGASTVITQGTEPLIAQSVYTFSHVPEPGTLIAFLGVIPWLMRRRAARTGTETERRE